MLEVRIIGTFDIQCDGKPVSLSSRASQSLFAYLILTAGTFHRREKLAGMFWPDETEAKARAYLRNELWRIRKALSSRSTSDYLIVDDLNISFNASAEYWLDATALHKLNDSSSADEWMAVLSSSQGELLPGFYDEWIVFEREHVRTVYEKKLAHLLELLESEKRWQEILEWAERWISSGQGSEAPYRYLMIAYDALGDRARVMTTYQRCVRALREMDLEPSEQTRALAFRPSSKLNIPIPLTSFIGREQELKEIANLLSKSRLVTLTGSGGVGKTRLAIQVVADVLEHFPHGVWFLNLAPLSDPELVPNSMASLIGLREYGDIPITELVINYFRSRIALIIIDNCEHLIETCAQLVNSLLISCERLSILATSREALRISGETSYRVPSMEVPSLRGESGYESLAKSESVRLFIERAMNASPGFSMPGWDALLIAQICQRLDGIPLAIELAAARTNVLSVQQILTRLDDRFSLLTAGLRSALPRQQTLRATIEWSYDLLSEKERLLFRRLAVSAGGWTLEAAEEVCCEPGIKSTEVVNLLSNLIDKSLVTMKSPNGDESRYRRLETIRAFAREKLAESGEQELMQTRHLDFFVGLTEKAEPKLGGPEQVLWLDRLERENDNLRTAFDWALRSDIHAAFRLCGAQGWFWYIRNHLNEGLERLQKILAGTEVNKHSVLYAKALNVAGLTLFNLGRADEARPLLEEVLTLWEELNEQSYVAQVKLQLGLVVYRQGDPNRAQTLLKDALSLCRSLGPISHRDTAWLLAFLGAFNTYLGDEAEADALFRESLVLSRQVGDLNLLAFMLRHWGYLACHRGSYDQAAARLKESLLLNLEVKHEQGVAASLAGLGALATKQGFAIQAIRLFGAAESLLDRIGSSLLDADAFEYEHNLVAARAQLDEETLVKVWADGHAMPFEHVIGLALST